jgi:hypothetical protein
MEVIVRWLDGFGELDAGTLAAGDRQSADFDQLASLGKRSWILFELIMVS